MRVGKDKPSIIPLNVKLLAKFLGQNMFLFLWIVKVTKN